ncbi:MAG: InlB B-repeat-containing protein [Bacteroidales bacterium]|nr:InlB B-repeat-containing protein [Bacteroidales bacterium]
MKFVATVDIRFKLMTGMAAAALLLAACAKEAGTDPGYGYGVLELTSVNSDCFRLKSAIDGTSFPTDKGNIGLSLFAKADASEGYGDGCSNVEYAYDKTAQKWVADPAIKVGTAAGYLYGYYPFDSLVTDIGAIPVCSSLDSADVMYAAPQDEPLTNRTAGDVSITMRHALARISITVEKDDGYAGEARLTKMELANAKTAAGGTLNAVTGAIRGATRADISFAVPEGKRQITSAGTLYDCLLVPSEVDSTAQELQLTLTIDGAAKSVTLSGNNAVKIISGVRSTIVVSLNANGLSVKTVSVDDWQTVQVGEHKVTVKLAEDIPMGEVMFIAFAEGEAVKIRAVSYTGKPLSCLTDDLAAISPDVSGNFYDFGIAAVSRDLVATVGYWTHTVRFDRNGHGVAPPDTTGIFHGWKIPRPEDPEEENFAFMGWYSERSCENEWDFVADPVVGDTVLYAKWLPIYTVAFDQNGHGVKPDSVRVIEGMASACPYPVAGGFTLCGWFTDKDCENEWDFASDMVVSDTTLYAKWRETPSDAIPGLFSLSPTNRVFFSRGNLWYDKSPEDGGKYWDFETHQYGLHTYPGDKGTPDDTYGLFGWGDAPSGGGNINTSLGGYGWPDDGTDPWGSRIDTAGTWYTPDSSGWTYLLKERVMANGGPRYTTQMNGITIDGATYKGIFFYPDFYDGAEIGSEGAPATWSDIDNAGILFLISAGGRRQTEVSGNGNYWSSTRYYGDNAYRLQFSASYGIDINFQNHLYGFSVRLVADYAHFDRQLEVLENDDDYEDAFDKD